uniref:Uncharacterized protein n=2 Tax=Arundo donax TaxID=35708 RepID=A0A0A8YVK5_ARUDO
MQRGCVEPRTSWHKWGDLPLRQAKPSGMVNGELFGTLKSSGRSNQLCSYCEKNT